MMEITGVLKMKNIVIGLVSTEAQEAHAEEGKLVQNTNLTEGPLTPW